MRILVTAALLVPAVAFAAGSPFDGTWKARLDSVKMTGKPDVWQIADGEYTCSSCVPAVKVKADGAMHKVAGHAYYDELSVRVISATNVEMTQQQAGKVGGSVTYTLSAGRQHADRKICRQQRRADGHRKLHRDPCRRGSPGFPRDLRLVATKCNG